MGRLFHPTSSTKHLFGHPWIGFPLVLAQLHTLLRMKGRWRATLHVSCVARHPNQSLNYRVFKIVLSWTSKDATECECHTFIFTCKWINILYHKHFYQLLIFYTCMCLYLPTHNKGNIFSSISLNILSSFHIQIPHDRVTQAVFKSIRRSYLLTWNSNSPFPYPDLLHRGRMKRILPGGNF